MTPRFFVAPELLLAPRVTFFGKEAHHIARVLRLGPGDRVALFDGVGVEADAVIVAVKSGRVVLDVVARRAVRDENPLELTIVQAALVGEKASWLVEKLVEIGVARVVFFPGERSVRSRVVVPRLVRIAQAAAEQCGRSVVPPIAEAGDLRAAIESADTELASGLRFFGEPSRPRDARTLGEVVKRVADSPRARAIVAIGPESGFSGAEKELLRAHKFEAVSLGPRTFRAESAGIVFASILMHLLGDLR
ncbi:MAG: 16S rRNA (uracil(1498)-N(3))-methyltransferase [Deltaproteobacteria bacterium]|nr:16S rRNA (uracil(1498)-N(3))-methyltransferase [Deltaproteobacteria bacterium]